MEKVIVAMSGGVDSSVAAALLQRQGYEVEGIFMKNWSPETIQNLTDCPWEQDQADAAAVCAHLGIPFRSVNFECEYKELVVDYMVSEYTAGRTPNPDVMCNSEIKFKAFLKLVNERGAVKMATGHYVRAVKVDGRGYVSRGLDSRKDQSYFLWKLDKNQVERSLFPVGEMPKSEVRRLALEFGLPTAAKKDSQGICFIGHIDLKRFLHEHITTKTGGTYLLPVYEEGVSFDTRLQRAKLVGSHDGVMFYTEGERAGSVVDNGRIRKALNGAEVPHLYVMYKNVGHNSLYISDSRNDPHAYSYHLELEDVQVDSLPHSPLTAQIRYQQIPARVYSVIVDGTNAIIEMEEPLWASAPGQSFVLYADDRVVGGGIIKRRSAGQETL